MVTAAKIRPPGLRLGLTAIRSREGRWHAGEVRTGAGKYERSTAFVFVRGAIAGCSGKPGRVLLQGEAPKNPQEGQAISWVALCSSFRRTIRHTGRDALQKEMRFRFSFCHNPLPVIRGGLESSRGKTKPQGVEIAPEHFWVANGFPYGPSETRQPLRGVIGRFSGKKPGLPRGKYRSCVRTLPRGSVRASECTEPGVENSRTDTEKREFADFVSPRRVRKHVDLASRRGGGGRGVAFFGRCVSDASTS